MDGLLDGGLLVFTGVKEGEVPAGIASPGEDAGPAGASGGNDLFWMLVISVAAVAAAVIILLIAIKRMKRTSKAKKQPRQGIDILK